jgi:glucosamine kinase
LGNWLFPDLEIKFLINLEHKTILIADSGSTKTDWLFAHDGKSVFQFQSGGINPFYQSKDEIAALLKKEVLHQLPGEVDKVCFYGAGCADETTSRPAFDALNEEIPGHAKIEVASDMLGAARGLCGRQPGIACILGTGANNAFYDGENITRSIGSLGFWLGDEGSGSYLGKTLLVAFLQNELPEDLHSRFANKYPEINRLSVLEQVYRKPFPNRYFATFSVFIATNISHPAIKSLVQDAFDLFVKKYVKKHIDAEQYPVHFTGSIAYYYEEILKDTLTRYGLTAGRILKSPLIGLVDYHLQG